MLILAQIDAKLLRQGITPGIEKSKIGSRLGAVSMLQYAWSLRPLCEFIPLSQGAATKFLFLRCATNGAPFLLFFFFSSAELAR